MRDSAVGKIGDLLVFEFFCQTSAELPITYGDCGSRTNTHAFAATNAILAIDPNEGRFVVQIRLQTRFDIIILIVEEARDFVYTIL